MTAVIFLGVLLPNYAVFVANVCTPLMCKMLFLHHISSNFTRVSIDPVSSNLPFILVLSKLLESYYPFCF